MQLKLPEDLQAEIEEKSKKYNVSEDQIIIRLLYYAIYCDKRIKLNKEVEEEIHELYGDNKI